MQDASRRRSQSIIPSGMTVGVTDAAVVNGGIGTTWTQRRVIRLMMRGFWHCCYLVDKCELSF